MPITTASTFTEISFSRNTGTEDVGVFWQSPDGDGGIRQALTNHDDTDLAILQEVYASADGFGSADIALGNYPPQVTTLEDIEPKRLPESSDCRLL